MAADRQHKIKQSKMHAFGCALPKTLKQVKTDEDYIKPLKPIFPDDLRECKTLFKGIHHLRYAFDTIYYIIGIFIYYLLSCELFHIIIRLLTLSLTKPNQRDPISQQVFIKN